MEIRQAVRGMKYLLCSLALVGSLVSATAQATTYYLAPTGSNTSAGTSAGAPWKTFAHAIPKLNAGDTLLLMDGVYTKANAGTLSVNCSSNARSGDASRRITVKAEHERKAWLKGDGSYVPAFVKSCRYWVFEGLHASSWDLNGPSNGGVFTVEDSSFLTFRRNLFHHNNRYENSHLLNLINVNDSLFEENEFYWFHRHAMVPYQYTGAGVTTGNVFRRNYCNSRGHRDIPGGKRSGSADRGQSCMELYPAAHTIVENNISEGNQTLAGVQSKASAVNNLFLGNLSIGDTFGLMVRQRDENPYAPPKDNTARHHVSVFPLTSGVRVRGGQNIRCENCSLFNSSGSSGFVADQESGLPNTGNNSAFALNSLAIGGVYGFRFSEQRAFGADYTNVTGVQIPYSPNDSHITNTYRGNPNLGTCLVFIPETSPLKQAGKNGADIGANVLYRYENGVLTTQPLWEPSSGKFPCGAIVPGVNDVAGASCFDVHTRLNVQANGCTLPAGYGRQVMPPPANRRLTHTP
jgi:hypothetical protein